MSRGENRGKRGQQKNSEKNSQLATTAKGGKGEKRHFFHRPTNSAGGLRLAERADLQEPGGCGGSRLAERTDLQEPGRLWMSVEGDGEKTMRRRKRRGKRGQQKSN